MIHVLTYVFAHKIKLDFGHNGE